MNLRPGLSAPKGKQRTARAPDARDGRANDKADGTDAQGPVALGPRIRIIRKERGLSLAEVSVAAGISVAMLSRIERGKSTPSLKALEKLRVALDVTMGDLFPPTAAEGAPCPVVRARDRISLEFPEIGLTKQKLSPGAPSDLELLLLVIAPGGGSGPEPWTRPGEKAGLVVDGAARLVIGKVAYDLAAGDSFQFDSSRPHRFDALGEETVRILWIIKSNPLARAVDA